MRTTRGPRLIGREDELGHLGAEFDRAAEGEFRCVLILGDGGLGKTRLAVELLGRAAAKATVLSARAYPFGQTESFGLWSEALERHLRGLSAAEVARLCGGFTDDLARLLRSVAATRGVAPDGEAPVLRLLDGLAALVANLAADSPVVFGLDDVHLGDPSSWQALQYLAHTLSDVPVLVVATARPAELAAHAIAREIVDVLDQDDQLRRLVLEPMDRPAITELCTAVLQVPAPAAMVTWVLERSRGNPLFALGLVRALQDEGGDLTSPRLRRVPEALAERVASRVDNLSAAELAVVEILAVMARALPMDELAALLDSGIDAASVLLHGLIRARLVASTGEAESSYELGHPLLQEVVYNRIGAAHRRDLHRLAARSLRAAGALGQAAPHFARCAQIGDGEAISALRDALEQAEQRQAYPEALDILATLVDLLPRDDPRWADIVAVLLPRAHWTIDQRVEVSAGRSLAAMRFLDAVLESSPDVARRAAVKQRLGLLLAWGTGEHAAALTLLGEARELFSSAGDLRSATVTTGSLAHVHGLAGQWVSSATEAARAITAADQTGDAAAAASALAALTRNAGIQGRFADAETFAARLIAVARATNDADQLSWTLAVLAASRALEGRADTVEALLAEIKASPAWRRSMLWVFEPGIRWLLGDLREASDCARRFVGLAPESLSPRRALGSVTAAVVALEVDRLGEARDCFASAQRAFGGGGWSSYGYTLRHVGALLDHRDGRPDRAVAGLRHAAAEQVAGDRLVFGALTLLDLAELAAEGQDLAAAAEAAECLALIARRLDRDLYRAYAQFAAACADLGGAPARAAASAEHARTVFTDLGYPLMAGRSLVVLGRALSPDDRAGALDAFERASAVFEACGAAWRLTAVRGLLRALGGRGRRVATAASGPAALTRRELEVARLAAAGRTARDIAGLLVVSERTVEGHLAGVYAKLGICSRIDLLPWADRLGR